MKTKILFIALMTMFLSFAQTSKAEINHIIKEQSDGIPGQKSYEQGISTVYNDGKSIATTIYSDVKSLSPKVEKAIGSLAESFKTTTNNVWNILVRQQLVWSIGFLILTLTSIINWYLFYKRNLNNKLTENDFVKGNKWVLTNEKNPDYHPYETDRNSKRYDKYLREPTEILIPIINPNIIWFKYLHLIICLSLSLLSIYHFPEMLTGFINPEFGALKTIAEVATQLK